MLKRTEGVVIKTQDYGETHKIITLFTKELGKISAISRGANKPKSRLNASSQLFVRGDYLIYVSHGLSTIQQGEIISSYRSIQSDIEKTAYAALLVELTYKLLEEKQPDPFIYHELIGTFTWMSEEADFLTPVMMYEMKMYKKGGFAPIVDRCVNCESSNELAYFSIQEGGLLCRRCATIDTHAIFLKQALIRILQIFQHVPLRKIGNVNIREENKLLLRRLLDAYYDYYGGYQLKARKFIDQLNELK